MSETYTPNSSMPSPALFSLGFQEYFFCGFVPEVTGPGF
jgi:hypothetical protein